MIIKTPTGITCFDEHLGGTFQGRPLLVTGRRNSGKTIFGLQFVKQGLDLGERGLMLSMRPTQDLAIYARSMGLNVDAVVDSGELFLLEYRDVVPGRDREDNITLPPEGFAQLMDIIGKEFIRRVVVDTVIPWVVMVSREHLAEHIFSFVRAFERLGVTTLFTCSHPVSPAAQHAHRILETNVPVSLTLSYNAAADSRQLVVNKYIGSMEVCKSMPYRVEPNRGVVCVMPPPPAAAPVPVAAAPAAPIAPVSAPVSAAVPPPVSIPAVAPVVQTPIPPAAPAANPGMASAPAHAVFPIMPAYPTPAEGAGASFGAPKTASFAASMLADITTSGGAPVQKAAEPPAPASEIKPNFADAMFRRPNKDR